MYRSKPIDKELLLFDYTVYNHCRFLLAKYNQKQKGKQTFNSYAPLIADEVELAITYNGDSTLSIKGKEIPIKSYTILPRPIDSLPVLH